MSLAGRLSHQLTPPRLDVGKRQNVFSPFGQLFLCIIGTLLSISVSVWLAFFSTDLRWRRAVFATAAAICSVMFMLLAFATYRRNSRHPPPHLVELGPSILRHRRSTAGGSARRSTKTEEECILPPSRNGGSQDHINRPPIIMQHTTPTKAFLSAPTQPKRGSSA